MILLLMLLCVWGRVEGEIAGCPSISSLDSLAESPTLSDLLLCFCADGDSVSVSCLYGSTEDHLRRAVEAVNKEGKVITQLSIQHMEFEQGVSRQLISRTPKLEQLHIRECSGEGVLVVHEDAFNDVQSTLSNVTIESCGLNSMPPLPSALRSLVLAGNDISVVDEDDFRNISQLEYLDLSGNMLGEIAPGAFHPLVAVHTLVLGNHNYMNESVLDGIGSLPSLRILDVSRADGIFSVPHHLFGLLPQLQVLKLGGCSLTELKEKDFALLPQLEQLDLRVNLIEKVNGSAFDGLANLTRLSLAGNYIKNLDPSVFRGLPRLEELDLGWNELRQISEETFSLVNNSLQSLDLRHNPIRQIPRLSLPNLTSINLSETNLTRLDTPIFAGMPNLETVSVSRASLSHIDEDVFSGLPHLGKIHLNGNNFSSLRLAIHKMPALEEINLAENPFICDDQLAPIIAAVNDRYVDAAKNQHDFLLSDANATHCSRPWTLRGESVFGLDPSSLQPYDVLLDTTTQPQTTTTSTGTTTTDTPFKLPDLIVGSPSNESIFHDDKERVQYDLTKTDDTKDTGERSSTTTALLVLLALTAITVVAVTLFIRKKKQNVVEPTKKTTANDGMVEIELDSGKN